MADLKLLLVIVGLFVAIMQAYNIPQELIHCYRGNFTQPSIGYNQQLLLELIRKVEQNNPTTLDMRMISVELIHR